MLILYLVLAVVLIIALVCVYRATILVPSAASGTPLDADGFKAGDEEVARFQELLRIPTVSRDNWEDVDTSVFDTWVPTLKRLYPKTFEAGELTMIDTYGILLRISGKDASLDPVVMMAHHDVVPVDPAEWEHDPFGAEIVDGEIWARGTLDTKCIVGGFFEATEYLLNDGWQPPRDVWYFSSCGEEVAGPAAPDAVQWMRDHDIHPYMVLDEGGAVAGDAPLGIDVPVAMVGVSEKGHVDMTIRATSGGGHASTPTLTDAPYVLCEAATEICSHPGKPELLPAVEATLTELASHSTFLYKVVFANLWLTRPLVKKILVSNPETAAMVRSTYALTQLEGSDAHNVLPASAEADVNIRTCPFETNADAIARAARTVAGTKYASQVVCVKNETIDATEPAPISPFEDDPAFDYIHRVVEGVYPEAGFAPYVQNSCTDSREFNAICDRVYRFAGFIYSGPARKLIHAPNERIGVDVYKRGLEFYVAFLKHLDQL
jgi:carboxypeptidase PM20D1